MKSPLIFAMLLLCACAPKASDLHIVPAPQSVKTACGSLDVRGTGISCDKAMDARSVCAVQQFADRLSLVCGTECKAGGKGLSFVQDDSVAPEAYLICVKRGGAEVRASGFAGFFYAIQTLKQLLPVEIYGQEAAPEAAWRLPCCEISDAPRFAYRGLMLDCCRHFFSVDEVKKVLDAMSVFKLNRMHWHLSEDQGWRI
ncbi:MAG: family 20 glycosylhydrolase, partial [Bacteroidales bacterium]|nr:family 20 glycosylhydrolase [Bacteroidales bacterium]